MIHSLCFMSKYCFWLFYMMNRSIKTLKIRINSNDIPGLKYKLSLKPWEFRGNKICVSSPDSWGGGADSLIPSWCLVPRSLQSCQMIAAIWTPTADMLLSWDTGPCHWQFSISEFDSMNFFVFLSVFLNWNSMAVIKCESQNTDLYTL